MSERGRPKKSRAGSRAGSEMLTGLKDEESKEKARAHEGSADEDADDLDEVERRIAE